MVLNQFVGKCRKGKTLKLGMVGKSLSGILFTNNKVIRGQIVSWVFSHSLMFEILVLLVLSQNIYLHISKIMYFSCNFAYF